jgi:type II secretory pathway pseudopilin PulG
MSKLACEGGILHMNRQFYQFQKWQLHQLGNAGFSYIEAVVALILALIILAATAPLFFNQRERNNNSQVRTGAVAVAQAVLEQQRLAFRNSLPALDEGTTPTTQTMMGNTYQVSVQIREFGGRNADGTINCTTVLDTNSRARCIRVQVRSAPGTLVYDVQTVYTQLR